ncbi:hypothetical protein ACFU7Y_44060, partial [Kitasatospora sp. NPDC057542]|uniref:hypothetical protein n=1 Tax=Kitasatospora sp. NPDC057542 TaxID=3346162 RepID=UPI00367716C0
DDADPQGRAARPANALSCADVAAGLAGGVDKRPLSSVVDLFQCEWAHGLCQGLSGLSVTG